MQQNDINLIEDNFLFYGLFLIVGSFLDSRTLITIYLAGLFIRNKPFPEILGGIKPRDLTIPIIRYIKSIKNLNN